MLFAGWFSFPSVYEPHNLWLSHTTCFILTKSESIWKTTNIQFQWSTTYMYMYIASSPCEKNPLFFTAICIYITTILKMDRMPTFLNKKHFKFRCDMSVYYKLRINALRQTCFTYYRILFKFKIMIIMLYTNYNREAPATNRVCLSMHRPRVIWITTWLAPT